MRPDLMRRLDFWIGVPVCAFISVAERLRAALRRRSSRQHPQAVLFIELAEMGSAVLAYPAVTALKSRYPDATVSFLSFRHVVDSVRVLDLVPDSHVMTIDARSGFTLIRDTVRFMRDARRRRIDTAINLEAFVRYSTLLTYLSGATTRVGFDGYTQRGLYTGTFLTHRVLYNPHIHTWQSFTSLVNALDSPPADVPAGKLQMTAAAPQLPRIVSSPRGRQHIIDLVAGLSGGFDETKRLILLNPNASELLRQRKWPIEYYARLSLRLLEDPDVVLGLTGVAAERSDAQFILEHTKSNRVVDFVGRTSLKELIDLYNLADVLVTNDSGPAHFAALTPIEIVVFFGPETPLLYKPLSESCTVLYGNYACSPCVSAFNHRVSCCTDNVCLRSLDVDTALAAVRSALARRRHRALRTVPPPQG